MRPEICADQLDVKLSTPKGVGRVKITVLWHSRNFFMHEFLIYVGYRTVRLLKIQYNH